MFICLLTFGCLLVCIFKKTYIWFPCVIIKYRWLKEMVVFWPVDASDRPHATFILIIWSIWPVDPVTKSWVMGDVLLFVIVFKQTDVFGLHEVCLSQKSWEQWGRTGVFSVPGPRLFIINTREGNHRCDPLLTGLIVANLGIEYCLSPLHFLSWFICSPVFGPLLVLEEQMFWGQLSLFCSCTCALSSWMIASIWVNISIKCDHFKIENDVKISWQWLLDMRFECALNSNLMAQIVGTIYSLFSLLSWRWASVQCWESKRVRVRVSWCLQNTLTFCSADRLGRINIWKHPKRKKIVSSVTIIVFSVCLFIYKVKLSVCGPK